jgi:hypothetical protein
MNPKTILPVRLHETTYTPKNDSLHDSMMSSYHVFQTEYGVIE